MIKPSLITPSLSLSLIYFLYYFGFGCLFPLLAMYFQSSLGLSGTQIGILLSINPIVMIFAQPLWGLICDYTRAPKQVLAAALFLTAVTALMLGAAHSYTALFGALILLAFFQSAVTPIADSITMSYAARKGKEYGSFALWGAFGFGIASITIGRLADSIGLSIIFTSFAAVLLLCMLAVWKAPKEKTRPAANLREGMGALMKIPAFLLFMGATFFIFGPMLANNFYFSFYVKDAGGTLTGIGISFLLAVGSEIPFMKASAKAIGRWGLIAVIFMAAFISGFRWLLYYFDQPLLLVYITSLLQGVSVGLFIPSAINFVYRLAPDEVKVTAVSLYTMMGSGLGTWFCTFTGGILLESYSIHAVYLCFSVLTCTGIVLLFALRKAALQSGVKIATVKKKA